MKTIGYDIYFAESASVHAHTLALSRISTIMHSRFISCWGGHGFFSKGEEYEAGEHAGSGSAHLLTPFEALSHVNRFPNRRKLTIFLF
jgi:hypothetical protein